VSERELFFLGMEAVYVGGTAFLLWYLFNYWRNK